MSKFQDTSYLKGSQYAGADKLSARIALHELYTVSYVDIHRWIFDVMLAALGSTAKVLEVGTGRGDLWKKNAVHDLRLEETAKIEREGGETGKLPIPEREKFGRIPNGWEITLTDLSAGMVVDNKAHLGDLSARFRYGEADVHSLPYPTDTFDAVVANYMLYHAADLPRAIREIRRVLKPGGVLFAMTNGERHMREINQFVERAGLAKGVEASGMMNLRLAFSLQNGAEALAPAFDDVIRMDFPTELHVTEVQPVLDYIASMLEDAEETMSGAAGLALARVLEVRLAEQGVIRISKETGLFVAR
jgi:ubiquinone/menaquinone biosynthesis C-methylase UbiE